MSDAELARVDEFVMSIIAERDAWARHDGDTKWHLVNDYDHGSVLTECRGRWSLRDDFDTINLPPVSERCGACHLTFMAMRGQQLVDELRKLFDIEIRASRPIDERLRDAMHEFANAAPEIAPPSSARFDGEMTEGDA